MVTDMANVKKSYNVNMLIILLLKYLRVERPGSKYEPAHEIMVLIA